MEIYQIEHYVTVGGQKDVYTDWLRSLRDVQAKVAVIRRVARIEQGNFGDHKFCRDGVWELRIDAGPGYRVYYGMAGQRLVLLLCAGSKRTQEADIDRAVGYWHDWQRRVDE